MRAILVSIQPKWCELIASGRKIVEVRKTKIPVGTKVYIYQTKMHWAFNLLPWLGDGRGKVIGEFVCNEIHTIQKRGVDNNFDYCYLSPNKWGNDDVAIEIADIKHSCIGKDDLNKYGENAHYLYTWHISDLKIYSRPKELVEFTGLKQTRFGGMPYKISRPPQSWCYVETV